MEKNRIENKINQSFVTLATVSQSSEARTFQSVTLGSLVDICLVSPLINSIKKIVCVESIKIPTQTSLSSGKRFGDYNV